MTSKIEAVSRHLNNYLNYNHIGLCIFTNNNFFKESQLSLGLKFLLNWKNTFSEKFDSTLDQTLYVAHLYNRTFPVIFNATAISKINFTQELKNYSLLISGLTTTNDQTSIEIPEPKLLVILDQILDKKSLDRASQEVLSFASSHGQKNLITTKPLTCDLYHWDKNTL